MRMWRKETLRRIMSMLLCLVMVLGMLPVPVLAEETGCTVADCTGSYVEGVCNVCGSSETPAAPEEKKECSHSGGTANCVAQAICEICNEPYGELSGHTGGKATCKAQAVCTVCTTAYGELAVHTGGTATCTAQAVCEVCRTGYGELLPHSYGVDGLCACGAVCGHNYAEGVCGICGAECEHNFAEGVCTVCGMGEPSCICEVACGGENGIRYDCPACVLDFGRCAHFVVSCTCVEKCTEEARNLWCPVCGTRGVEECEGEDQGVVYAHNGNYICNGIDFTNQLNSTQAYLSGNYYLDDNFYNNYTNLSVSTGQTANLCLQGHTLTVTYLNIHGTLNLYDCKGSGKIAIRLVGDVCVFGNGTLNIFGGTVENLKNLDGAAVRYITYNKEGNGSVTHTVKSGNVTLTANPANGYKFVKWESTGTQGQTSGNQYIMTASGTYNVTAVFEVAHTHSYGYSVSADSATITATCSNTDGSCPKTDGGKITIYAPTLEVYGGTGAANATLSATSISGVTTLPAIQYQKQENDVWGTATTEAPTDAGRYKASLTVVTGKTISVEYTIDKAAPTYNPPSGNTYTYDGIEHELVTVNGDVTGGTMYFKVGDGEWTDAIPKASAAGIYTVSWKIVGDANHTDVTGDTVTASIHKTAITPTVALEGWTYGEAARTPAVSGNSGGGSVTFTYYTDANCTVKTTAANGAASEGAVPANAGTYYVKADIAETENYTAGSAKASFAIAKKTVTAVLTADKTYDGMTSVEVTATVAAIDMVSGDTITISGLTGVFDDANAGENKSVTVDTANLSITGDGVDNYNVVIPGSLTATIDQKALNDVTLTLSPVTFEYDGSEKKVTSITAHFGEVKLTEGTDYTVDDSSVTRATDVSTGNGYAVTITAVANGNYTGSQTAYWTITKVGNSWTTAPADSYSWVYGSPATPTAVAKFGNVKVEYRLANADNGDADYTDTVPADAGSYLVRFSVAGTADYEALSEVKNLTIIKADLTITAGNQTITYGDAAPVYSVTGSGFQYEDDLTSLDAANASVTCSYQQYDDAGAYDIVPSGYASNNYEITYVKGTLTVGQKEIGIQWSTEPIIFKENTEQAPTATATGLVTNGDGVTDTCTITVTGAQINAGTYTATAESLSNPNYKLPGDVTTEFTIQNADQAKPTGVVGVRETSKGQGDGKITGVDSSMEYRAEGETAYTAITGEEVTGLAAGKYYVRYKAKTNYNASEDAEITVSEGRMLKVYLPLEQIGYTISTDPAEVAYNGTVTLTYRLAAGYTEGDDFAVTASVGTATANGDGIYTISGITEDTTVSVAGVSDITAPTAEISVTTNKWTEFLNEIAFNLFFKQTQTVTITAADAGSGLASIEYYLSNSAMTVEQVKAITAWSGYNGIFSIDAENQYVIYAKVTDRDQNILYISSDGIVLDKTQPVISGVTNGATYYTTQKVTATDNTVLDTLSGTNADNTIPGDPAQETRHNIVATDKAGNTTTFEITMKPISSLAAGLPTEDTVELTDKDAIEIIKANVSDVLANQSAHATDAEKAKLDAIIQECNDLLDQIRKAEAVIALIQALPDASGVEPDNKTAIDAYDTALAAYNDPNLPASSKRMVGEENKVRLDAVGKALVAYDITHQSSKYYVKGSGKVLTFTANGYYAEYGSYAANAYGKFVGVEVDGKAVDAKNYTAKAGSTVITLKSSYLDSLSTGKHTIKINYIDGSTDGEDTFRISVNNGNPFTGDHTHIMLFSGVALTSLLCMAMMIVFFPRKKGKYQR